MKLQRLDRGRKNIDIYINESPKPKKPTLTFPNQTLPLANLNDPLPNTNPSSSNQSTLRGLDNWNLNKNLKQFSETRQLMFCQREDKTHKNHHLAAINAINSRSKTNSPYFIQKIRSQDVRSVYGAYKGNLTTRKLDKGNPEQTSQTIIVVLNNDGNKSINKELHNTVLSNSQADPRRGVSEPKQSLGLKKIKSTLQTIVSNRKIDAGKFIKISSARQKQVKQSAKIIQNYNVCQQQPLGSAPTNLSQLYKDAEPKKRVRKNRFERVAQSDYLIPACNIDQKDQPSQTNIKRFQQIPSKDGSDNQLQTNMLSVSDDNSVKEQRADKLNKAMKKIDQCFRQTFHEYENCYERHGLTPLQLSQYLNMTIQPKIFSRTVSRLDRSMCYGEYDFSFELSPVKTRNKSLYKPTQEY